MTQNIQLELPPGAEIVIADKSTRFRGTAQQILSFSEWLRKLKTGLPGQFLYIGDTRLSVSSSPRSSSQSIDMPADAWNVMASKFVEVATAWEKSPFDFNDCGYWYPPLEYDLGVEIIGLPMTESVVP